MRQGIPPLSRTDYAPSLKGCQGASTFREAEKTARKLDRDRASRAEELNAMLRRQDGVADPAPAAVTT